METRIVNYTTKPITEFTPEDTIYISKMYQGHQYIYYCQFIKYERGTVYGKPIINERKYGTIPAEMKAKLNKCFLWGNGGNQNVSWDHCNWFTKNKTVVE